MGKTFWLSLLVLAAACGNDKSTNKSTPENKEPTIKNCPQKSYAEKHELTGNLKKITCTEKFVKLSDNEWVLIHKTSYRTYTFFLNKEGNVDSSHFKGLLQGYSDAEEHGKTIYSYGSNGAVYTTIFLENQKITVDSTTWTDAHTSKCVRYHVDEKVPGRLLLKSIVTTIYNDQCKFVKQITETYNELDGIAVKGTRTETDKEPANDTEAKILATDAHNNPTKKLLTLPDNTGVSYTYTYEYY